MTATFLAEVMAMLSGAGAVPKDCDVVNLSDDDGTDELRARLSQLRQRRTSLDAEIADLQQQLSVLEEDARQRSLSNASNVLSLLRSHFTEVSKSRSAEWAHPRGEVVQLQRMLRERDEELSRLRSAADCRPHPLPAPRDFAAPPSMGRTKAGGGSTSSSPVVQPLRRLSPSGVGSSPQAVLRRSHTDLALPAGQPRRRSDAQQQTEPRPLPTAQAHSVPAGSRWGTTKAVQRSGTHWVPPDGVGRRGSSHRTDDGSGGSLRRSSSVDMQPARRNASTSGERPRRYDAAASLRSRSRTAEHASPTADMAEEAALRLAALGRAVVRSQSVEASSAPYHPPESRWAHATSPPSDRGTKQAASERSAPRREHPVIPKLPLHIFPQNRQPTRAEHQPTKVHAARRRSGGSA